MLDNDGITDASYELTSGSDGRWSLDLSTTYADAGGLPNFVSLALW